MRERRRIERLLNEINDLINKIKSYDKPLPEITNEIKYKLFVLETAVDAFEQINQAAFLQSDVDIEKLQKQETLDSPLLNEQDLKTIQRAKQIENEAIVLSNHLSELIKEKTTQTETPTKTSPKKRRGGGKTWIPL